MGLRRRLAPIHVCYRSGTIKLLVTTFCAVTLDYLPNIVHEQPHPIDRVHQAANADNTFIGHQDVQTDVTISPVPQIFDPHFTSDSSGYKSIPQHLTSPVMMNIEQHELISNPNLIRKLLGKVSLEQRESLRPKLLEIFESSWWRQNQPEPSEAFSAFITALPGREYKCLFCRTSRNRMDRAVAHCRKHLHHRPFYCDGEKCRNGPGAWYENSTSIGLVLTTCIRSGSRFFTRECLTAHRKQGKRRCSVW